jgi:hypothetical protein
MGEILRVPKIRLVAAFRPMVTGADENDPPTRFEDILHWNPVRSRAFHRHAAAALLDKPLTEFFQRRHGGCKRPCLHFSVLIGWTRNDSHRYLSFADIDASASLDYCRDLNHRFAPECESSSQRIDLHFASRAVNGANPGSISARRTRLTKRDSYSWWGAAPWAAAASQAALRGRSSLP